MPLNDGILFHHVTGLRRIRRSRNHRSESSSDDDDEDDDADDERDESLLEPLASRRLELCDRLLLRDRLPLRLLSPFDEAADDEDEDDDFCFFFFLRSFFSLSRSCSRSRFSRRLRLRSFLSCSSLSKAAMHEQIRKRGKIMHGQKVGA